jgi:hypothetical protein
MTIRQKFFTSKPTGVFSAYTDLAQDTEAEICAALQKILASVTREHGPVCIRDFCHLVMHASLGLECEESMDRRDIDYDEGKE